MKIADSAAIRQTIPHGHVMGQLPTGDLSLTGAAVIVIGDAFMTAQLQTLTAYSYFQSGSSGCLRSQSGGGCDTTGIVAKL